MKKAFLLLALVLVLSTPHALSEQVTLESGSVALLSSGDEIDLDGDGEAETVSFSFPDPDGGYNVGDGFTLDINGSSAERDDCMGMTGNVRALRMGDGRTYLLLDERGLDDPYTYAYCWDGYEPLACGGFPGSAEYLSVQYDTFTARVKADTLCTWWRDADFSFAKTYDSDDAPLLVENPRASYAMHIPVTLERDLVIYRGMGGGEVAAKLPEGIQGVLCATDDATAVCLTAFVPREEEDFFDTVRGWVLLGHDRYSVRIDGEDVPSDEVFGNLPFAG